LAVMSKNVRTKALPKFRNEDEERAFWADQDSTAYLDWSKGKRIALPNLRPSLKTISLRLPEATIAELKMLANRRDVPYQSLLKVFLSERIAQERRLQSSAGRKRT
jgi:predicted DNA binding CopG/RHH family protein